MSQNERSKFKKEVTILIDTREQKNQHITDKLDEVGIKWESCKLDYGDYSFRVGDKDFRMLCVVERKAKPDELYSNVMSGRERFEKEFSAATSYAKSFTLLIENCESEKALRTYRLKDRDMYAQPERVVQDIGKYCWATISAWKQRFSFHTRYVADKELSAGVIIDIFYWFWHSYKKTVAPLRNKSY